MASESDFSFSLDLPTADEPLSDLHIASDIVYLEDPEESSRSRNRPIEEQELAQPLHGPLSIEPFEDFDEYGPPSMEPLRSVDVYAPPKPLRGPGSAEEWKALQPKDASSSKIAQSPERHINHSSESKIASTSYNIPNFLDELTSNNPPPVSKANVVSQSHDLNMAAAAPQVPTAMATEQSEDKMRWNRRVEEEFKRSGKKAEKEVRRFLKRLF